MKHANAEAQPQLLPVFQRLDEAIERAHRKMRALVDELHDVDGRQKQSLEEQAFAVAAGPDTKSE